MYVYKYIYMCSEQAREGKVGRAEMLRGREAVCVPQIACAQISELFLKSLLQKRPELFLRSHLRKRHVLPQIPCAKETCIVPRISYAKET